MRTSGSWRTASHGGSCCDGSQKRGHASLPKRRSCAGLGAARLTPAKCLHSLTTVEVAFIYSIGTQRASLPTMHQTGTRLPLYQRGNSQMGYRYNCVLCSTPLDTRKLANTITPQLTFADCRMLSSHYGSGVLVASTIASVSKRKTRHSCCTGSGTGC